MADLANNPGTTIPNFAGIPANSLVAHYDFDEGDVVAPDVSGNGNDIVLAGNFGGNGARYQHRGHRRGRIGLF